VGGLVLLAGSAAGGRSATPSDYPSCGTYWNRNTPVSLREQQVNRCIVRAARNGRRARAVAALTTIEGDPIVQYVFVRATRDVLLLIDTTRDAFGPRGSSPSALSAERNGWIPGLELPKRVSYACRRRVNASRAAVQRFSRNGSRLPGYTPRSA